MGFLHVGLRRGQSSSLLSCFSTQDPEFLHFMVTAASAACPRSSHPQTELSLLVQGPAGRISLLASPPPVSGSSHQDAAGISCAVLPSQQIIRVIKVCLENQGL